MAEIIGFAICWVMVAGLMLWGVLTERRRGGPPFRVPPSAEAPPAGAEMALAHPSGGRSDEWTLVEVLPGATAEVADTARYLVGAWLAANGMDLDKLPANDLRTEVITSGEGSSTRVLVRSAALHHSHRRR